MPTVRLIARFIASLEPFVLIGVGILFWFPSSFPAQSDGVTGIITAEWAWLVTGMLPFFIAYWVVQTRTWHKLPSVMRWMVGIAALIAYLLIYIRLPFLPVPSYAIDRADWFWMIGILALFIPIRWLAHGRHWRLSAVEIWISLLLMLMIVNVLVAPDTTGYPIRGQGLAGLGLLMRPLLGMLMMGYLIDMGVRQGKSDGIIQVMLMLTAILAMMALASTQWTVKSQVFTDFIAQLNGYLPNTQPFFRRNSINPNEIGGALTWLVPFCGVILFHTWERDKWAWRFITLCVFITSTGALILSQSRFSLLGVIVALMFAFILLIPNRRLQWLIVIIIALLAILQAGLVLNLFTDEAEPGLSERDERSASQRLSIWNSAIAIIRDYPLTGVGLNNFRFTPVRNRYPIEGYPHLKPPHAHNEVLQIGADMGIGGMLIFIGLNGTILAYLWVSYQRGTPASRILALGTGAGILAHIGYSIGDAIPLWDRFHFIYWMMLGVGMTAYHLRHQASPAEMFTP